jgi:DNA-binding GntR family transcriptional regulator
MTFAAPRRRPGPQSLTPPTLTSPIPPGRPVPSKRFLIEEYGIAGSTVDKAMQILKDAGLIRTAKGLGLFVGPEDERPGQDRG